MRCGRGGTGICSRRWRRRPKRSEARRPPPPGRGCLAPLRPPRHRPTGRLLPVTPPPWRPCFARYPAPMSRLRAAFTLLAPPAVRVRRRTQGAIRPASRRSPPPIPSRRFEVAPGFRVELVAAEPLVQSPVACDFDEDGRLYVAELPEYNQYAATQPARQGPRRRPRRHRRRRRHGQAHGLRRGPRLPDRASSAGTAASSSAPRRTCSTSRTPTATARPTCARSSSPASARTRPARGSSTRSAGRSTTASTSRPASTAANSRHPDGQGRSRCGNMNVLLDPQTNNVGADQRRRAARHGARRLGPRVRLRQQRPDPHADLRRPLPARTPSTSRPRRRRSTSCRPASSPSSTASASRAVAGPAHEAPQGGQGARLRRGRAAVRLLHRRDRRDRLPRRRLPGEYRGNVFVGEVANNLVFRAKLEAERRRCPSPSGPTRSASSSRRSDIWFRPVQFANAPDGCLYVLDMYRELIEGAAFLAPES